MIALSLGVKHVGLILHKPRQIDNKTKHQMSAPCLNHSALIQAEKKEEEKEEEEEQ